MLNFKVGSYYISWGALDASPMLEVHGLTAISGGALVSPLNVAGILSEVVQVASVEKFNRAFKNMDAVRKYAQILAEEDCFVFRVIIGEKSELSKLVVLDSALITVDTYKGMGFITDRALEEILAGLELPSEHFTLEPLNSVPVLIRHKQKFFNLEGVRC